MGDPLPSRGPPRRC